MTQEERYLVLKDLCGRLITDVIVTIEGESDRLYLNGGMLDLMWSGKVNYRPYLRPMSSMTEEEKYIYRHMLGAILNSEGESIMFVYVEDFPTIIDWLLKHHFDFRGLIEKGLALEAPEDMYA